MKYHDITRELISAPLYPGAPLPQVEQQASISRGAPYNFSLLHSNLHAGTHCDAYLHFVDGDADVADMPLDHFIGTCYVLSVPKNCLVGADFFKEHLPKGVKRLLLKSDGTSYLAPDAGQYLIEQGVITVGTDAWSVAPVEDEGSIHVPFLSNHVAIIESLDLSKVQDGEYYLVAAPSKICGAEAGPCRAILFEGVPVA
ncbi:cyclase family protein [Aminiphilus circumscriptus]|jgi:arylformamidase|uniref:cyclase family protein n=1 Tax=Aminiphilus circumscriptus TaxID=290732 RepID=UPI0004785BE6|nr:cyclase family protein [Aminiphilus circumscriptus]